MEKQIVSSRNLAGAWSEIDWECVPLIDSEITENSPGIRKPRVRIYTPPFISPGALDKLMEPAQSLALGGSELLVGVFTLLIKNWI